MFNRRLTLLAVVFALLVAMSQIESGFVQGQGAQQPAPAQGRGGGAPQAQGRGGRGTAFTPPAGAKDLKSVLYNWTWHMGMLRSGNESELIKTLEYQAEGGTIQVDGQPCTLKKYRVSVNYQVPGYRTQIECTRTNGQTYKNIETMS